MPTLSCSFWIVAGNNPLDRGLLEKIAGKLVLTVLNKCDLPTEFDTANSLKLCQIRL